MFVHSAVLTSLRRRTSGPFPRRYHEGPNRSEFIGCGPSSAWNGCLRRRWRRREPRPREGGEIPPQGESGCRSPSFRQTGCRVRREHVGVVQGGRTQEVKPASAWYPGMRTQCQRVARAPSERDDFEAPAEPKITGASLSVETGSTIRRGWDPSTSHREEPRPAGKTSPSQGLASPGTREAVRRPLTRPPRELCLERQTAAMNQRSHANPIAISLSIDIMSIYRVATNRAVPWGRWRAIM